MLKIAIVSASNPDNQNTGMLTVEFAAASLQSELPGVALNWFTFPPFVEGAENEFAELTKSTVRFHFLPESLDQLYEHDVIIFWGDFLNSRAFLIRSGPIQVRRLGYSPEQTWDVMARCMLLRDAPDAVLERTILFGGTILPNRQSDLDDEAYGSAFTRLVSGCRHVWMREPVSAARVEMLRNSEQSCLGVDPALLLPASTEFPVSSWSEGSDRRIGLFVGSRSHVTKHLIPFAEQLAQRFTAEIDWLPWLEHVPPEPWPVSRRIKGAVKLMVPMLGKRGPELQAQLHQHSHEVAHSLRERTLRAGTWTLGDLLRQLGRYEFIITDTYHICVNAWRLGIPAVCIGVEQPNIHAEQGTLTDLKKYILYLTYQAADLYFTPAQLRAPEALERAVSVLESSQPQAIAGRIQSHARDVKARLLTAIRQMLGVS